MNDDARRIEAAASPYRLPETFDGLVVSGFAGRGGMGNVYVAHDVALDRRVAVKLVDGAPGADGRESILHEARMLARLSHPNVVAVYRVGEVDGRAYIAYEYVEGTPLDALEVPLPPERAIRIGIGLSRGLVAVHARGVLHRDVKPANAMLGVDGEIKLIDFGIAKSFGASFLRSPAGGAPTAPAAPAQSDTASGVQSTWDRGPTEVITGAPNPASPADPGSSGTRTGFVMGTPRYLAPERWAGQSATAESDVFSFGVVLYELLAGRLGTAGLPSLAREGLPPLPTVAPHVPEALATLVEACLSARPGDRPSSMVTVRDRLEAMAGDEAPTEAATQEGLIPEIRYARTDGVSIAYSAWGSGRQTLLVVPPFVTNLDATWAWPELASFYRKLGEGRRLVLYDKRGTGLSDRTALGGLDARLSDIRAVMDAAGVERAILFGSSEGVATAVAWAALHPERTEALVLYGGAPAGSQRPGFTAAPSPEMWDSVAHLFQTQWGGPVLIEVEAPSLADDSKFRQRWANFLRVSASPSTAIEALFVSRDLDVSHLLPAVRVPTLIVHREGDRLIPAAAARALGSQIPNAEVVLLAGEDHMPMVGDTASIVTTVRRFLERDHDARALPAARIGTFVALHVGETIATLPDEVRALWRMHAARARAQPLQERRGVPAVVSLQGLLTGVNFAFDLTAALAERGVEVRAGIVTGDIERDTHETDAEAWVRDAQELARAAAPGEVHVARGLADLLAGTGVTLEAVGNDAFCARRQRP